MRTWNTKSLSNKSLKHCLLQFRCYQNCMSSASLVPEVQLILLYLSVCYFAPTISQSCIRYILVNSSKLLAYLFHVRFFQALFEGYHHRVKSVHIRSFFWSVISRIQSKCGKIQTRKNSVFGYFSRSASLADS